MTKKTSPSPADYPPVVAGPEQLPALPDSRPPSLSLAPDAPVETWHHNFDLATRAGRDALVNASNVADWIPRDGGQKRIDAVHYLVHPDEQIDRESGETRQCTSLVLVGRDGQTARLQNEWSLRRLHAMLQMYSPEEWAAGIPIEVYAKQSTRSGNTYGSFRILT